MWLHNPWGRLYCTEGGFPTATNLCLADRVQLASQAEARHPIAAGALEETDGIGKVSQKRRKRIAEPPEILR